MSNTLFQIYQSKTIVLAKTLVLKLDNVAKNINAELKKQGYEVDENNPRSWKYYLNLFGEYHQYDHDRLRELSGGASDHIRIKVAGDNQPVEVDFTKALIFGDGSDLTIANEYRFNTQYYNALITRYPEFNSLIRGILNPISPDISIPSEEGEILYCGGYMKTRLPTGFYHYIRQDYGPISDNFLIESNEENLIPLLQEKIYKFIHRWFNVNYYVSANLFYPSFLGSLYLNIVHAIGNIRLANIKHPLGFTHSFHIREYMESYGRMGWVTEHISKREALWLYRNWMWLDANRGKQMVFNAIVDNVLTPANIPLSGYRLRHDLNLMNDEDKPEEDQYRAIHPTAYMEQEVINFKHTGTGTDYNTIQNIIEREISLARENYFDREGQVSKIAEQSETSMFDDLNTKVLESTMLDLSNHQEITLDDIGLNFWLFTASHGYYKGTVIATHPLTNDRIQLTPLNAYILTLYCLNKGWADYQFETIPNLTARWVPRVADWKPGEKFLGKATFTDMRYGTDKRHITDDEILDIMGSFKPNFTHGSSVSLSREISRLHTEAMRQYFSYSSIEDAIGRAHGQHVSYHQWWFDVPCVLSKTGQSYDTWLLEHGIDLKGFSRKDYVTFGLALIDAATGLDSDTANKVRNRQNAILAILKHFGSYTFQIIQNASSTDSFIMGGRTLRVTNDRVRAKNRETLPVTQTDLRLSLSAKTNRFTIGHGVLIESKSFKEKIHSQFRFESPQTFSIGKSGERLRLPVQQIGIVGFDIPEVVIDTRVKAYSYLTTHPYTEFGTELQVVDTAVPLMTMYPPPLPKPKEQVAINPTYLDTQAFEPARSEEQIYIGGQLITASTTYF